MEKENQGEEGTLPTLQQLMTVMQQMQGELVALRRRQVRGNHGVSTNGEPHNSGTQGPARSADRKLICYHCKEEGHIRKRCPKMRSDDAKPEKAVRTVRKEREEDVPLLLIDTEQLITEEVKIETEGNSKTVRVVVDTGGGRYQFFLQDWRQSWGQRSGRGVGHPS